MSRAALPILWRCAIAAMPAVVSVVATASLATGWIGHAIVNAPIGATIAAVVWGIWAVAVGGAITLVRVAGAGRGHGWVAVAWGAAAASALADAIDGWWPTSHAAQLWPLMQAWFAPAVAVPIDEETMKALGVFVILAAMCRSKISGRAGARVGMFVGLGFSLIEGWAYSMDGIVRDHHDGRDVLGELVLRGFVTIPVSHIAFTGVAGLGLGLLMSPPPRQRCRRVAGVAALALAIVAHGLHNSPWTTRTNVASVCVGAITLVPALILVAIHVGPRSRPARSRQLPSLGTPPREIGSSRPAQSSHRRSAAG